LDIFSRSGDIRDQSMKWSKIDRNFACFWPRIFLGECPPNFWTCVIKLGQILTMWQVSGQSVEGTQRTRGKKKEKHHEHFIRPPVTTYGRPNYLGLNLKIQHGAIVFNLHVKFNDDQL